LQRFLNIGGNFICQVIGVKHMEDQDGMRCCPFYPIGSAAALAELGTEPEIGCSYVGKVYYLTNDIDLSDYAYGEGWNPIGSAGLPFGGILDGRNFTISGLRISRPEDDYQGLFGSVTGIVRNVTLKDINISGRHFAGGLAGQIHGGIVDCVRVSGKLFGENTVGGVAGYARNSNIVHSRFHGHVAGCESIGGIIGHGWRSSIQGCITQKTLIKGQDFAGGIVGCSYSGVLNNCRSTGTLIGRTYVGGVAGSIVNSEIRLCSATASVIGELTVGGIAGLALGKWGVDKCFAACSLQGDKDVGNIVGQIRNVK